MDKRVYISADYALNDGDRSVVNTLNQWANDRLRVVSFVDMAKVVSGSVANDPDCRICDLKAEFNAQINASSAVIFVVGNKTADRTAGSACNRVNHQQSECRCTPYKQNTNGAKPCRVYQTTTSDLNGDIGNINGYSYLEHEFKQAERRNKKIIIVYNSVCKQPSWLPSYMKGYEGIAQPFWIPTANGDRIGDYQFIKRELGYV